MNTEYVSYQPFRAELGQLLMIYKHFADDNCTVEVNWVVFTCMQYRVWIKFRRKCTKKITEIYL